MLRAKWEYRRFHFKRPSGTSRGILTEKHAWFISIWDEAHPEVVGLGECSIIPGLSPEFMDIERYECTLNQFCEDPEMDLTREPALKFAYECALRSLSNGGSSFLFNNAFSRGERKIPINGLIWMGDETFMQEQIEEKLASGFTTIKMKIGAIDFETELSLLRGIRQKYTADQITLRVDANGAFHKDEALEKLKRLSELDIHSIEQPIARNQWDAMARLCEETPIPIALDEELIQQFTTEDRIKMLDTIRPQFIILKPSLHGGISGTREWIELAGERQIDWWMTSALESNVGLNAICQLAGEYDNPLPQGLGTGSLYTDNIESDLIVEGGYIWLK